MRTYTRIWQRLVMICLGPSIVDGSASVVRPKGMYSVDKY